MTKSDFDSVDEFLDYCMCVLLNGNLLHSKTAADLIELAGNPDAADTTSMRSRGGLITVPDASALISQARTLVLPAKVKPTVSSPLSKAGPCIVCGSAALHMDFATSCMGDSYCRVTCSNKKCGVSGRESRQQVTAVKYWNGLKDLHDQLTKAK